MAAPIAERQNLFGHTCACHASPSRNVGAIILMRLALGEMSTVVLDTQKVLPNKLDALGFTFNYPNLKIAFEDLIDA